MESSMPKVVAARLISESVVPKQQSVPKSLLFDHKTNQICSPKERKVGCYYFCLVQDSHTSIRSRSLKCLGQRNQIPDNLRTVCPHKRSASVEDNCKEPEEIGHGVPVFLASGTVSK
ncbi:unnamed protein product [Hymenolepis diminuta]|uniref:Uncharacterized protein n=1 Tax=Hymenolepis diminuta TaxID=6216 RepID=A0A564Y3Q9_HYMDI|nr:unnamed protein product [Hymenolepis diminuta]